MESQSNSEQAKHVSQDVAFVVFKVIQQVFAASEIAAFSVGFRCCYIVACLRQCISDALFNSGELACECRLFLSDDKNVG